MPDAPVVTGVADEVQRIRKERVHTTMLIELLVLLVFLSMAFAFVTKDESSVSVLQTQIENLRQEVKELRAKVRRLTAENRELAEVNEQLRSALARWMERPRDSIPADDQPIVIPKRALKELTDRLSNAEAMVRERQDENANLRQQLAIARGGGTDRPNCPVTAGFLVKIELLGDGSFRTTPSWLAGSERAVGLVPGAISLASGRAMSAAQFSGFAGQMDGWARSQSTPCGFRAQVTEHHSNLALYKRQVRVVERYFYVRRN